MKRLVSILLTACIASTLLIPTSAAPVTFSDVPASAWYYSDVLDVQQYGIIEGMGDNKFLPNAVLSYGQAVTMAARAYAYIHGETIPTLERWYEGPINYAIEKGIIGSQEIPSDINFPCDRQTMANMFYMVIDDQENTLLNNIQFIPDVELSGGSAHIYALYRFGILTGSDKYGTFRPQASITRAETAAIINRVLDQDKRKTFSLATITESEAIALALPYAIKEQEYYGSTVDRNSGEVLDSNEKAYLIWFLVEDIFDGEPMGGYMAVYWVNKQTREVRFVMGLQDSYDPRMVNLDTGEENEAFLNSYYENDEPTYTVITTPIPVTPSNDDLDGIENVYFP